MKYEVFFAMRLLFEDICVWSVSISDFTLSDCQNGWEDLIAKRDGKGGMCGNLFLVFAYAAYTEGQPFAPCFGCDELSAGGEAVGDFWGKKLSGINQ